MTIDLKTLKSDDKLALSGHKTSFVLTHKIGDEWFGTMEGKAWAFTEEYLQANAVYYRDGGLLMGEESRGFKSSPEALTNERKNQHGDWVEQSGLSYDLKTKLRSTKNWSMLTRSQTEALDMIAVKISRILTGDPDHEDHWDDIAGYAYLGKGGHKKA